MSTAVQTQTNPSAAPVMQAESLTRHYGVSQGAFKPRLTVKALVDVSFSLAAGQTLAVVGESGCGKSTLARQLTLIEPPTEGRLQVGGEWVVPGDRAQYKRLRSQVQMVFQNPYASLNPRQKIGTQIAGIQGATKESVEAIKVIGKTIGEVNEIATTIAAAVEDDVVSCPAVAMMVK